MKIMQQQFSMYILTRPKQTRVFIYSSYLTTKHYIVNTQNIPLTQTIILCITLGFKPLPYTTKLQKTTVKHQGKNMKNLFQRKFNYSIDKIENIVGKKELHIICQKLLLQMLLNTCSNGVGLTLSLIQTLSDASADSVLKTQ